MPHGGNVKHRKEKHGSHRVEISVLTKNHFYCVYSLVSLHYHLMNRLFPGTDGRRILGDR